jgi:Na+-driven multidrug efflux pump
VFSEYITIPLFFDFAKDRCKIKAGYYTLFLQIELRGVYMELFKPDVSRILLSVFLVATLVPFVNSSTVNCMGTQCGGGATLFVTPIQTWYLYHSPSGFGLFYLHNSHINYLIFWVGFLFYYLVSCAVVYTVTHHRMHRKKKE